MVPALTVGIESSRARMVTRRRPRVLGDTQSKQGHLPPRTRDKPAEALQGLQVRAAERAGNPLNIRRLGGARRIGYPCVIDYLITKCSEARLQDRHGEGRRSA